MHNSLNIPLTDSNTRRHSWRVVWILASTVLLFLVCWVVFLILSRPSAALLLSPDGSDFAVEVPRTRAGVRFLAGTFGAQQALPQHPWTVVDILKGTSGPVVFYYANNELIGFSARRVVDSELFEQLNAATAVHMHPRRVLITSSMNEPATTTVGSPKYSLSSLSPWFFGYYYGFSNATLVGIRRERASLFIPERHDFVYEAEFPEDSTPLFAFSSSSTGFSSAVFELLRSTPDLQSVFSLLSAHTHYFAYSQDERATLTFVFPAHLSLEESGALGRQLYGLLAMRTRFANLPDGTLVNEIVLGSTDNVSVSADTSLHSVEFVGDVYSVNVSSSANDAETKISLEYPLNSSTLSEFSSSSCVKRSNELFWYPSVSNTTLPLPAIFEQSTSFHQQFVEIRVNKRGTSLCY